MREGWKCPVCSRGNSPDTKTCPCKPRELPTQGKFPECSLCGTTGAHFCPGPSMNDRPMYVSDATSPFTNDATNRFP